VQRPCRRSGWRIAAMARTAIRFFSPITPIPTSFASARLTPIGEPFTARAGRWIGAKVGLFALGTVSATEYGCADYDWFHVQKHRLVVRNLTNFRNTPYFCQ